MSQTTQTISIAIPDDVKAFAIEQKVDAYMPTLVEAARQNFPEAPVRVVLEEDHEDGTWHIVLFVQAGQMNNDEFMAAYEAYHRALLTTVPGPLTCTFRLGLGGPA
jgi:hypothetical protein